MLEGNEVEKQLGEYGKVAVDLSPDGKLKVVAEVHVDLIAELEKLAAKTSSKVDDQAIAWVKGMLALLPK